MKALEARPVELAAAMFTAKAMLQRAARLSEDADRQLTQARRMVEELEQAQRRSV